MGNINIKPEIMDIRWKAYEDARKKKVAIVMDERRKVIDEKSNHKMR